MGKRWSKWMKLNKENIEKLPEKTGVYEIIYPETFGRLIGTDMKGVLMVGCNSRGGELKTRINAFFKAIHQGEKISHSEGNRFFTLKLYKKFHRENLQFRFIETKDKKEAKELENKLLKNYQQKYGELPPLNNSGGY